MDRLQLLFPIYAAQGCCHNHLLRYRFHMEKVCLPYIGSFHEVLYNFWKKIEFYQTQFILVIKYGRDFCTIFQVLSMYFVDFLL